MNIQQGRCLETAIRKWRGANIEGEGARGTNRVWEGNSNSDGSSETAGIDNRNDDDGVVDRDNNSNNNNKNNNNNDNNKNGRDDMSKRTTTSTAAAAEAQSKRRTATASGFLEEDASSGMLGGAEHNVHHRMVQGEGALSDADRARFGDMPPDTATAVRATYPSPNPAAAAAVARTRSSTRGTMGVLYWQLSDTWQGPSWSTIEHDGAWKVSHHMVRRAFSIVSIGGTVVKRPRTAEESGDGVGDDVEVSWFECHVTSDLQRGISGSYTVSAYLWDDNCDPVASWGGTVGPMSPGSTTIVFQATTEELRRAAGTDRMIVHMVFEETVEAGASNDAPPMAVQRLESVYYLPSANAVESVTVDDLPETGLSWELLPTTGAEAAEFHEGERTVRVRARAHAAHVTLRLDQSQPKPQQYGQRRGRAASVATAMGKEHPPRPQPPQGGHPWQQEAPPLSSPQQLPRFHANDGGFHVFPCRAHDLQVRYRGNNQDLKGGSSGIKAESLRELLAAIEAGKRDQPGSSQMGRV
ncbi:unnamed protein product [Ectocarpus sp. CCAP 1310/34]|nr:unnamed protein product [Ectocarpus sp. CCAP 1310/34]